jgi:hypothetical protein
MFILSWQRRQYSWLITLAERPGRLRTSLALAVSSTEQPEQEKW